MGQLSKIVVFPEIMTAAAAIFDFGKGVT